MNFLFLPQWCWRFARSVFFPKGIEKMTFSSLPVTVGGWLLSMNCCFCKKGDSLHMNHYDLLVCVLPYYYNSNTTDQEGEDSLCGECIWENNKINVPFIVCLTIIGLLSYQQEFCVKDSQHLSWTLVILHVIKTVSSFTYTYKLWYYHICNPIIHTLVKQSWHAS